METASERGRDLFELTTTGHIVTDITFALHLQPGSSNARHDEADHFQRASSLADTGARVASIIVVVERLESTLWENPEFASWDAHVNVCEAMAEARHTETSSHFGPDEVLMRAKELGFPEVGGSESDDPAYRTAVFDAIVQERDLLRMLDILDREREACRYEFDDDSDDEPVALEDEEAARRWNQRRREVLAPHPVVRHKRRYVLPDPLSFWDPRNSVQQWYFVQSGADLHWWQGGSASSGQRENHGRWAHVFGAMSTHHGVEARTVVLRYDRRNVLRFVTDSPSFMIDSGISSETTPPNDKRAMPYSVDSHSMRAAFFDPRRPLDGACRSTRSARVVTPTNARHSPRRWQRPKTGRRDAGTL